MTDVISVLSHQVLDSDKKSHLTPEDLKRHLMEEG